MEGKWKSTAENLLSQDESESKLVLDFSAGSVNIVVEEPSSSIELDVKINGTYLSKDQAGKDIQFDGERSFVKIVEARLYNIFDSSPNFYHLELSTSSSEFKLSAFTFGD